MFSLAELDPDLTDRVILLADTKDSQPLHPARGPYRIKVPDEKRPERCACQVKRTVGKNSKTPLESLKAKLVADESSFFDVFLAFQGFYKRDRGI